MYVYIYAYTHISLCAWFDGHREASEIISGKQLARRCVQTPGKVPCFSLLQCVAVFGSVLWCLAVCYRPGTRSGKRHVPPSSGTSSGRGHA